MSDFEQKIKANLKANLNKQVQNLDAETRQLLATARRKALNQPARKSWFKNWQQFWLPTGSLALCGLIVVFILVNPKTDNSHANIADNQAQQQTTDQVAALELLTEADDEATDPDFYLWADEILATESVPHAV
jgi:hypothetical protein